MLFAIAHTKRQPSKSFVWTPVSIMIFFLFENSINYYIHKSSVTFQPCKITMTYFEILIKKLELQYKLLNVWPYDN